MQVLDNLDLAKNELQSARIHNLAAAPGTPVEGQVYWDTVTKRFLVWNGTTWTLVASDTALLQGQNGAYYLARANHTGTQLASTISDFDAQVRTSRLDQMAAPTADVAWNSKKITGLLDPTNPQDAATKAYVDAVSIGLDPKPSARLSTTVDDTLAGLAARDGVVPIAGDRVLVKAQTLGENNGIYVAAAGAWARSIDADTSAEVTSGMFVWVSEGTDSADSGWFLTTNDPIVLGTTPLTFVQFSGAGQVAAGAGLTKTGNTLDVGQGVGITVAADTIGVDIAVVARKYRIVLAGVATAYVVNHALANQYVMVQVYRVASPFDLVLVDVERTDANNCTVRFAVAPASGAFEVVVIG